MGLNFSGKAKTPSVPLGLGYTEHRTLFSGAELAVSIKVDLPTPMFPTIPMRMFSMSIPLLCSLFSQKTVQAIDVKISFLVSSPNGGGCEFYCKSLDR